MSPDDDAAVLVVWPVGDPRAHPVAGHVQTPCDCCGVVCMVAPSSFTAAVHLPAICIDCALKLAGGASLAVSPARDF